MVKTFKQPQQFTSYRTVPEKGIDIEDLVLRVAKAVAIEVGKEMREALKETTIRAGYGPYDSVNPAAIQIDESVIPMDLQTNVQATNLERMTKEETAVDKDLKKSKSKLANILGRKK